MTNPSGDHSSEEDYIRVPRWMVLLGFGVLVATLILGLFTFPASPASNIPAAANPPRPVETAALSPRTVTSASRTLGDPNAAIALVEFGDFQ